MNDLQNLSEEQLVKLIAAKKGGQLSDDKDYSNQDKRGVFDSLRDTGYGLVKGVVGGLDALRSPLDKKFIESQGGKEPDINQQLNKIKSPYPSPAGEVLQKVGEYAPLALGGLNALRGTEAVQGALRGLPSLTKKGMSRPYIRAAETATEEGVSGLQHPESLVNQTRDFLQSQNVPSGTRLERAASGEYEGTNDIKNVLGQLSRSLPFNSGEKIGAQNLHADWINSLLRGLEEGGFTKTHEATKHAQEHYAKSAKLRSALTGLASHASGYSTLRAILHQVMR